MAPAVRASPAFVLGSVRSPYGGVVTSPAHPSRPMTVDVHVRRLRAKLGVEHEHLIETIRGVGYRATAPI